MRISQNRLREFLLLAGVCGLFFFFRLSSIGLLGPDEPRYAQIAREMLMRHDWVTPTLYGHTWLEKPILLYWGEMISYSLFGFADWAARVPSAVAATALVLGTFLALRRIRHDARLDGALMVATCVLVLGFSRAAATDMLLASPFCLSMLAWFCWYQSRGEKASNATASRSSRWWLVLFYALNALAMLAKGPVAPALAAFIVIAFCAAQRDMRSLWRTIDPLGIVVFLAIAAPWYILVQLRTPEFFTVFFVKNNVARFGSNLYRHKQPFWYYIPVALVATMPWTAWVVCGLWSGAKEMRTSTRPSASTSDSAEPSYAFEIFLTLWALIPIVFFSLSGSKLPGYILPAVPPLLILAAVSALRRAARDEQPSRVVIFIHAALLAVIAAAVCLAPRIVLKVHIAPAAAAIAAFVGTVVFLAVALAIFSAGWRMLRFITLLPLICCVGFLLRGVAPVLDATQSYRPIAHLLMRIEQPGELPLATFHLNRNAAFGLAYYLDRRVTPYEGLEVSPAVYEIPAAVPSSEHILVTREGSLPTLKVLLNDRSLRLLGAYRPQRVEIYHVSPRSPAGE